MDEQQITELLEKYKNGLLDAQEKAILESWYLQQAVSSMSEISDEDLNHNLAHIASGLPLKYQQPKYQLWKRIGSVAAILMVAGLFYCFFRSEHPTVNTIAHLQDVSPGANKAVLTLANGKKISITDAKDGELARQSGISIKKTADGQLVYSVYDASPAGKNPIYNTIETPRGGQYQVILPDGTKVWLNAASSLKYPTTFSGLANRKVELSGEAYLEVAKNRAFPFIVKTLQQEVEVLGTHFNVNSYSDEEAIKTTLLEGAVLVHLNKDQSGQKDIRLAPGQQSAIYKAGSATVAVVDVNDAIAWKKGYFEFTNENVYQIMRKVARWYDVEVIYQGEIPLSTMEGTMSRFQNVSKILDIMQSTGLLKFKIEGRKIYVSKA
ncbi:FecR family protein [Pedobacter sp. N36a]|nr:FecR family protein [Pedobacter sp. N36a]